MNNRKLLIFASFLLLAGCTTDPDMDNNVGGGTSAQTPSAKIVNTSADAAAETLLVYFNDRAVETIESTAAATRTAATRSGVASVDDVLSRLEIVSLERLFTYDARSEEQTRAAGLHKWYILTFGQGADLEKAARELAGVAEVSRIQFDTKLQKASVGNPMPFRIDETGTTRADFSGSGFNDPGLPNQWHYSNNGDKMFAATTAAGNDATNFASYPGGYRSYVSVTSFGPDYLPAYYTNYGPGCNVAAPGGDASISPAGTSAAQVLSTLPSELPAELGTDGADYGYMQGTSMACPHVSGVAALGLSYALAKGRHYTVDEFKSMLLTAVNDIDSYIIGGTKNGMVLRNYRKNMGTGSIDAYQLLMQIEGTPCLPAKVGVQQVLSLDKFFGQASANLTYKSAEMSQADMDKLGITAAPAFSYGKLQIKCTKPGVAKIKIKAMAGSSSANGEMSGMEITKEFAIIARAVQAGNGGWL